MYSNSRPEAHPRTPGEIACMEDFRMMIDGYDCGIRHMDAHIGQIFDALRDKGVLDDMMIVVSSDHGENLGELGFYAEHGTADRITTRIPMVVRGRTGRAAWVPELKLRYPEEFKEKGS